MAHSREHRWPNPKCRSQAVQHRSRPKNSSPQHAQSRNVSRSAGGGGLKPCRVSKRLSHSLNVGIRTSYVAVAGTDRLGFRRLQFLQRQRSEQNRCHRRRTVNNLLHSAQYAVLSIADLPREVESHRHSRPPPIAKGGNEMDAPQKSEGLDQTSRAGLAVPRASNSLANVRADHGCGPSYRVIHHLRLRGEPLPLSLE